MTVRSLAGKQPLMRAARVTGLVLAAAAFPCVWMALAALRELGGGRPSGVSFLDFQTYAWSRYAFVGEHVWLLLAMRLRQHLIPATMDIAVAAAVAAQIVLVWAVCAWLGVMGWGFPLW